MGDKTPIEWADATWNPWYGCRRVSTGCRGCYAAREMKAYGMDFGAVTRSKTRFELPLKLTQRYFIFACSWSDFFIEDADAWRPEAWDVIRRCPRHTFLLLTKRPGRIPLCLPPDWGEGWSNVWLGVSAENQRWADKRIPELLKVPANLRFASLEPLLGPMRLYGCVQLDALTRIEPLTGQQMHVGAFVPSLKAQGPCLSWIIAGGESGPGARPCDPAWLSALQQQCAAAGVPFFLKQLGGYPDKRAGDKARLEGRLWQERP